jgi:ABC-type Na+ transport system ATPase subunit NatA
MKILTTLLFPTSGEVRVAGFDAVQKPREVGAASASSPAATTPATGS